MRMSTTLVNMKKTSHMSQQTNLTGNEVRMMVSHGAATQKDPRRGVGGVNGVG